MTVYLLNDIILIPNIEILTNGTTFSSKLGIKLALLIVASQALHVPLNSRNIGHHGVRKLQVFAVPSCHGR